ncbi:MAG: FkbM family methyltransferase [Rhodopila sp.]|nr:FkbM family methyltransferase [Rhodopila sp.]
MSVSATVRRLETSLRDVAASHPAPGAVEARVGKGRNGCWIYGAGGFGQGLARALDAKGSRVSGFIDRGKAGGMVGALPVVAPATFTLGDGAVLLIGLYNPAHGWGEPVAWARAKGFSDILTPVDLVDLLPEIGAFWLTPRAILQDNLPALTQVADLLADDASIDVLGRLLAFRLTGDPLLHPAVQADEQYLPRDFRATELAFPNPIALLDGGAFTGDTGLFLAREGVRISEWVAFEPDLANFAKLVDNAASLPTTRRSFYPLGLSDGVADHPFDAQGAAASRIGEGATGVVRCVSIDTALAGFRPDYVKLDIEGAEEAALAGMARTLDAARPQLAISAYHKPRDLSDLAHRVRDLLPGARLYLRQHAENCFDTVLYALT